LIFTKTARERSFSQSREGWLRVLRSVIHCLKFQDAMPLDARRFVP
jgi:hypothetical protein